MKTERKFLKKIAVTGPESTGKSYLAENLARHYGTEWVPEFAREYLKKYGPEYREKDILAIARGQILRELEKEKKSLKYLFCDTEAIVTKIWSEVKYGRCHPEILRIVKNHRYDLYLLCDIDLPWEYDPLREHPEMRKDLFKLYNKELKERGFPFFIISGSGEERINIAIRKIDDYFL